MSPSTQSPPSYCSNDSSSGVYIPPLNDFAEPHVPGESASSCTSPDDDDDIPFGLSTDSPIGSPKVEQPTPVVASASPDLRDLCNRSDNQDPSSYLDQSVRATSHYMHNVAIPQDAPPLSTKAPRTSIPRHMRSPPASVPSRLPSSRTPSSYEESPYIVPPSQKSKKSDQVSINTGKSRYREPVFPEGFKGSNPFNLRENAPPLARRPSRKTASMSRAQTPSSVSVGPESGQHVEQILQAPFHQVGDVNRSPKSAGTGLMNPSPEAMHEKGEDTKISGTNVGSEVKDNSHRDNASAKGNSHVTPINESLQPNYVISFTMHYGWIALAGAYSICLLHLPSLYCSRVRKIFEGAQLSVNQLRAMVLEMGLSDCEALSEYMLQTLTSNPEKLHPSFRFLSIGWDKFVDSLIKEWKTLNITSALLLSAILTLLQIRGAEEDPVTKYIALYSLLCALTSLVYGCIYIIRFNTMREPHKAVEWALQVEGRNGPDAPDVPIWWNVWVLLAMPAVWLTWSLVLYIAAIMSFIWRSDTVGPSAHLSSSTALAVRLIFSLSLLVAIFYGFLIVATFRQYGDAMDDKWRKRVNEKLMRKRSQGMHTPFNTPRQEADINLISDEPLLISNHDISSHQPSQAMLHTESPEQYEVNLDDNYHSRIRRVRPRARVNRVTAVYPTASQRGDSSLDLSTIPTRANQPNRTPPARLYDIRPTEPVSNGSDSLGVAMSSTQQVQACNSQPYQRSQSSLVMARATLDPRHGPSPYMNGPREINIHDVIRSPVTHPGPTDYTVYATVPFTYNNLSGVTPESQPTPLNSRPIGSNSVSSSRIQISIRFTNPILPLYHTPTSTA